MPPINDENTRPLGLNLDEVLKSGREVLKVEGAALLALCDSLGEDFVCAVAAILGCKGRVIVSGMGKSGHIARKIAATFASTGTPSQFVHPAEASHGDLGMITEQDVCILISNSGETSEINDILAHTRRFSIPLIGMSSKQGSSLLRAADIGLLLPSAPEACSIGMVPTTSTTMTLALGDALCVAVMNCRGFARDDFNLFHPGGKLGAMLLKVKNLMHMGDDLPLVKKHTAMSETILEMTAKSFGVAGLIDHDGRLIGIITDGDLRRHIDGLLGKNAGDVAHLSPKTISPDALAQEALRVMNDKKISCLFVVDDQNLPIGLIRIHDCLRAGVA